MLQQHCNTFVIRLPGNPLMEHCKQLTILMKNVKNHLMENQINPIVLMQHR